MIEQFKIDLKNHFPSDLVDALLKSYEEIKTNYILNKWEPSELNGGKFVEAATRMMQFACKGGVYTPIGTSIRNIFDELKSLEQTPSSILDSYKLHIPRCLGAIYNLRNRRGVGHLGGDINPNKADAYLIITIAEWILAELFRINYNIPLHDAQLIVESLISRKLELVFEGNGIKRVLNPKLSIKDKILLLLYSYDKAIVTVDQIISNLKYQNKPYLKNKVLKSLDSNLMIELSENEEVYLLPPGIKYVEDNYENWKLKK